MVLIIIKIGVWWFERDFGNYYFGMERLSFGGSVNYDVIVRRHRRTHAADKKISRLFRLSDTNSNLDGRTSKNRVVGLEPGRNMFNFPTKNCYFKVGCRLVLSILLIEVRLRFSAQVECFNKVGQTNIVVRFTG